MTSLPPSNSTTHVYDSPGVCIYCGARGVKLSDEHIVAANLGGTAVFKKASCFFCATITGRLEQHCLRGMFQDARVQLGLRQRRRSKIPKPMPARVTIGGEELTIDLAIEDHPTYLFLPYFSQPKIMTGLCEVDTERAKMKIWHKRLNFNSAALRERGVEAVSFSFVDTWRFGRMLAKIGHSFAAAQLGLQHFKPLLVPLILDDSSPPPFLYVGGTYERQTPIPVPHRLEIGTASFQRSIYVAVRIRLFAFLGAPAYLVIVGET